MVTTLAVIGSLLCLAGIFNLSNVTLGVGLIAVACFLGIFARLWQATNEADQAKSRHEEIIKAIEAMKKQ
jgi:hypothetical protein